MFSPLSVLLVILAYMGALFALAQWVEQRIATGRSRFSSPWIYALSQAVFFTSWTFYGSVGWALERGLQFFGIYVGAMLGMTLASLTFARMVRAKEVFHITSIADFISTRYHHSQPIAALVTLIALIGLTPYIALQLKAIVGALAAITVDPHGSNHWNLTGTLITALMILFTILFGVRRLDPTERHQGMIAALVAECVVKLAAFLIIGIYVTWFLFSGPSDILARISQQDLTRLTGFGPGEQVGLEWLTLIVLGFAAVHCLPRQFHVAVVENSDQQQLRQLPWTFPLYSILISLFVIPVAAAGVLLGLPAEHGDQFMLLIPQSAQNPGLTLLSFLGGFAAATGMVIITTMTLATMAANHLLLPMCEKVRGLRPLRSAMLQMRWLLVVLILSAAYLTARTLDQSYLLVAIGLISFAAVLQYAPAMLIGMYWRPGSSAGAFCGLLAGFVVWFYTLVVPALIDEGWLPLQLMSEGLLGIEYLRPEQLFGVDHLSPLSHSVFWSLTFNTGTYLIVSLLLRANRNERRQARELFACMRGNPLLHQARPTGLDAYIDFEQKTEEARSLLTRYLPPDKVDAALKQLTDDLQASGKDTITIIELMEFHRLIEQLLAGAIGAASAHSAVANGISYASREAEDLKALYSHLVDEISPPTDSETASDDPGMYSNRYDALVKLQQQLEKSEQHNRTLTAQLRQLESRLERQYDQNFKLRLNEQRLRRENEQLKTRFLDGHDRGS